MFSFLLAAGSFCSLQRGDKEDHRMEMRWCLIALKPLCHFLLFDMYVMLLDSQDDCVATQSRELPSEVPSAEISRCNGRRMCNSATK